MIMNRITLIAFFLVVFCSSAQADQFTLLYWNGYETFYVSYSQVIVKNANYQFVFNGFTDQYGRIVINLPNGFYHCSVYYQKKWCYARLNIDNKREMKQIYLEH